MTKIIGLTGGIGSGKSTIAGFFKAFGVPVYVADDAGREVMEWPETIASVKRAFGNEVFENGIFNRKQLAEIVFNDAQKLQQLNAIIHPAIRRHFFDWLERYKPEPFIIREAAILFESGAYVDCDKIITVTAPLESRIQRVIERDKTTREAVLQRIQNQWTDEQRISKSDYVIDNSDLTKAQLQTAEIFKKLTNR